MMYFQTRESLRQIFAKVGFLSSVKPLLRPIHRRFRSLNKYLNKHKRVVAVREGVKYELDLDEMIDASIFYDGCFEPQTAKALTLLCKQGMIIFDVGANVGCHTFQIAQLVGPTGRVVAFEPTAWAFGKLRRNLELNNFGNIVLERLALSDKNGLQDVRFFNRWPVEPGVQLLNKLHPVHKGYGEAEAIRFVTLDEYMSANAYVRLDLIKIDVDGYEAKFVRGAARTLMHFKPVLVMELGEYTLHEVGDSLSDLLDIVSGLGYRVYYEYDLENSVDPDHLRLLLQSDDTINAVLIPSERKVL